MELKIKHIHISLSKQFLIGYMKTNKHHIIYLLFFNIHWKK
jgi:hypothetical protein